MWQILQTYSGAVVAVFTVVLVGVTIVYVFVTCRLLKQSRNAFFADMFLRMMEMYRGEIEEIGKGKEKEISISMRDWTTGYREAFIEIDKRLGMDFAKIMVVGLETAFKAWDEQRRGKEKEEESRREIEDLERPKNHKKNKL